MENLPKELFKQIMLYNSHPVADVVKNSHKFKYKRLRLDIIHGSPFDRGCSGAY